MRCITDAEYLRDTLGLPDCQIAICVDYLEEKFDGTEISVLRLFPGTEQILWARAEQIQWNPKKDLDTLGLK